MEGLLEALPRLASGCRHRSGRAGLVGARVAQGPYDAGVIVPAWWGRE